MIQLLESLLRSSLFEGRKNWKLAVAKSITINRYWKYSLENIRVIYSINLLINLRLDLLFLIIVAQTHVRTMYEERNAAF